MERIDNPKVLAVVPLRAASRFDTANGGVLWSGFPRSTGRWSEAYSLDDIWGNFSHSENAVSQDLGAEESL
jgi:hypothetical protein